MADSFTFEVKGLRELGLSMKELDRDVALKIAWQATGAAARVVKTRAQRNIQSSPAVRTGVLLKSVIIKRMPKGERGDLTAEHIVTVRGRGKRNRKGVLTLGAPYAHMVEFGTVHMPAEPFLRPALEGGQTEAVAAMKRALERGIIKDRAK
jgi:HK97 gp10 family phage protein